MGKNLRDRIATAIQKAHSELHLSLADTWDDECLRLADAVIRELGLQQEDGECGYCHAQLPGCRYITEWTIDE